MAESHLEDMYEDAPAAYDRQVVYRGLSWVVLKDVFAPYPTFGSNRGITPKNQEMYAGKTVLDLGSGSGVRAILAKMSGAIHVVATDITEQACINTAINAQRFRTPISVVQTDMFTGLGGRFDTIVSYLPSRDAPITGPQDIPIHDPGLTLNRQLIAEAYEYLEPGGSLHTSLLDQGNIPEFKDLMQQHYEVESHKVRPHETGDWHFFSLRV